MYYLGYSPRINNLSHKMTRLYQAHSHTKQISQNITNVTYITKEINIDIDHIIKNFPTKEILLITICVQLQ